METQNSPEKSLDASAVFGLFAEFVAENKSLSILFGSTIITAFFAEFSLASLIVHAVNIGILFGVRAFAKRLQQQFVPTFVLLLISIGLNALMSYPTTVSFVIQIANAIALLLMCLCASNEHKTTMAKPAE